VDGCASGQTEAEERGNGRDLWKEKVAGTEAPLDPESRLI
jgi:hypothetical protein